MYIGLQHEVRLPSCGNMSRTSLFFLFLCFLYLWVEICMQQLDGYNDVALVLPAPIHMETTVFSCAILSICSPL
jgi:hypothetical protein